MKLSNFRNLFDIHQKNGELMEFVSYMSQVLVEHEESNIALPVEFGNSQFHALSFLTEEVIEYADWVNLFETIQNARVLFLEFLQDILDHLIILPGL